MKIEGVSEAVCGLVETALRGAHINRQVCGELMPVCFVQTAEGINVIGGMFEDEASKEGYARAVRHFAIENEASAVLFLSEAYMKKAEEGEEIPDKPVSEMEGRVECVLFVLETMDGTWNATSPIKEDGTFDDPTFEKAQGLQGRLTNFLPDKRVA